MTYRSVLLPDKSATTRPRQVRRNSPPRGTFSKRRQRRRDYARTQEAFRKNPSRNILLPKIFHLLVLSSVRVGNLAKLDTRVRAFVRKVLYLPTDCPNAYQHAAVSEGGLGVPSLRYSVPV
ncbi:hypothetical protein AVEN_120842-1 [Araneus ventricosus]|uniref:Uncharacterized protein n=1 Tax=Araneus ventricosus TaxID=182803 RepID=A0A4Y2Q5S8_ARAVE|nr:hypothetical protein AVEN_120842-1 [Araneus ventricosus]